MVKPDHLPETIKAKGEEVVEMARLRGGGGEWNSDGQEENGGMFATPKQRNRHDTISPVSKLSSTIDLVDLSTPSPTKRRRSPATASNGVGNTTKRRSLEQQQINLSPELDFDDGWNDEAHLVWDGDEDMNQASASSARPPPPSTRSTDDTAARITRGMPNYSTWSIAELAAGVAKYGFRSSKIRGTMERQLEECWVLTHPVAKATRPMAVKAKKKKVDVSDASSDETPLAMVTKKKGKAVKPPIMTDQELYAEFRKILIQPELYIRVLRYEVSAGVASIANHS